MAAALAASQKIAIMICSDGSSIGFTSFVTVFGSSDHWMRLPSFDVLAGLAGVG